jgi:hypothetical protein
MHTIEDELKESKEEIKKKGGDLSKVQNLNETLIKEVKTFKQGNNRKGKWENDKSRKELKKKYE